MTESIVSNLGSIASIIGLIFVFKEKNSTQLIKVLIVLVVILSCSTSYLIQKNSKYESAQYQNISKNFADNMKLRNIEKQASDLLSKFPSHISEYEPGQNEGIVYGVLRFLESNKEGYPELYLQFKSNILSDVEKAKGLRGTSEHQIIMKSAARASYQLLTSMSGNQKN